MKQKDITPTPQPSFNPDDKMRLSAAVIDSAVKEGCVYLENLCRSIANTRQHASMMLAVFSAILAAMLGGLVATATFMVKIFLIAGIFISATLIFMLVRGLFMKRTIFFCGASPSHYLDDTTVGWLKAVKEQNPNFDDEDKYAKLLYLRDIQYYITQNTETQKSLVRQYRQALYVAAATYSGLIVTIIITSLT